VQPAPAASSRQEHTYSARWPVPVTPVGVVGVDATTTAETELRADAAHGIERAQLARDWLPGGTLS
jgi:hypothetical protein